MCDILVTIPTWEGYPILNLSHAVAILCFSWYTNSNSDIPPGTGGRLLNSKLRDQLRSEVSRFARLMPTKEHKRQGIQETLLRVIFRGLPKEDEVHRLIGAISSASDSFEKKM